MSTQNDILGLKKFLTSQVSEVIKKENPWVIKELGSIPDFLTLQIKLFNMPSAKELSKDERWQDVGASSDRLSTSDENYDEVFKNLSLEIMKTWPAKKAELNKRKTRREDEFIKLRNALSLGDEEFELAEQYMGSYRELLKLSQKFDASVGDLILLNSFEEQKALKQVIGRNLDTPMINLAMKDVLNSFVNLVPIKIYSMDHIKRLPSTGERLYAELIMIILQECHNLDLESNDEGSLEKLKSRFFYSTATNTYSEVEHNDIVM